MLTKTADDWMHNYIVASVLTGARTEELRALKWQHVQLDGIPAASPPVPDYVEVWRSGGDPKTRRTLARPNLDPKEPSPRELRHSFVSLLSDSRVSIEEISRLVRHSGTSVTELVYRHQIRLVLQTGAVEMGSLFGTGNENP